MTRGKKTGVVVDIFDAGAEGAVELAAALGLQRVGVAFATPPRDPQQAPAPELRSSSAASAARFILAIGFDLAAFVLPPATVRILICAGVHGAGARQLVQGGGDDAGGPGQRAPVLPSPATHANLTS